MFNKRSILKLGLLLLCLIQASCATTYTPEGVVKFTGEKATDIRLGIIVNPDLSDPRFIVVGMYLHHNFLAKLPYSRSWTFETNHQKPLFGTCDDYFASVLIGTATVDSPNDYYQKLIENLKKDQRFEIRNISPVDEGEKLVLRYEAKLLSQPDGKTGRFLWNFWVTVPHNSLWYTLHLSLRDEKNPLSLIENRKIISALNLFEPGFFGKKRK